MKRLSVTVNPDLLELATKVSGAHNKRETIEQALHALIQQYRRSEIIRHAGAFPLTMTRKTLRQLRHKD